VKKRSPNICATSVIIEEMPKVSNQPMVEKIAKSGHSVYEGLAAWLA
jgi:hypothetical protein